MIPWWAEKDAIKQHVLSFQEVGENRKIVIKIKFTPIPDLARLQYLWGLAKASPS